MPPFERLPIPKTIEGVEGLSEKDNAMLVDTISELKRKGGILEDLAIKLTRLGPSGKVFIKNALELNGYNWETFLKIEQETSAQSLSSIVDEIITIEGQNHKNEHKREQALEVLRSELETFLIDNLSSLD